MDTSSPGGGPGHPGPGASDLKLLCVLLLLLGVWGAWPRARTSPGGAAGDDPYADRLIPGVRRAVLDVNAASAGELAALPGVGRVLARRIAEGRAAGAYRDSADLDRVPGVGPSARARVAPYVVFLDGDP